jgi:transposase
MTTAVLSGPERRRRWTSAQKLQIAMESLETGASAAVVARRHDVHPNLIHAWRRQLRTGELSGGPEDGAHFVPVAIAPASGAPTVSVRPTGTDVMIEVVLRNGRVLRLPEGIVPARAVALADALEGIAR